MSNQQTKGSKAKLFQAAKESSERQQRNARLWLLAKDMTQSALAAGQWGFPITPLVGLQRFTLLFYWDVRHILYPGKSTGERKQLIALRIAAASLNTAKRQAMNDWGMPLCFLACVKGWDTIINDGGEPIVFCGNKSDAENQLAKGTTSDDGKQLPSSGSALDSNGKR